MLPPDMGFFESPQLRTRGRRVIRLIVGASFCMGLIFVFVFQFGPMTLAWMGEGEVIDAPSHVVLLPSVLHRRDGEELLRSTLGASKKRPILYLPKAIFSPLVMAGVYPDEQETLHQAILDTFDVSPERIVLERETGLSHWDQMRWALGQIADKVDGPAEVWVLHGRQDTANLRVIVNQLRPKNSKLRLAIVAAPLTSAGYETTLRNKTQAAFQFWMMFAHLHIFGEVRSFGAWPNPRAYVRGLRPKFSTASGTEK